MKVEVSPEGASSQLVWCSRHCRACSLSTDTKSGALIACEKCSFRFPAKYHRKSIRHFRHLPLSQNKCLYKTIHSKSIHQSEIISWQQFCKRENSLFHTETNDNSEMACYERTEVFSLWKVSQIIKKKKAIYPSFIHSFLRYSISPRLAQRRCLATCHNPNCAVLTWQHSECLQYYIQPHFLGPMSSHTGTILQHIVVLPAATSECMNKYQHKV